MKTQRKMLKWRLLFLLLAAVLPVAVEAQDFEYTSDGSEITITGYTGAGGAVIIPDTIDALPVTTIGESAFNSSSSLTSITISDSVTAIGRLAFRNCTSPTSVTIGSGVTSIGDQAFYGCNSLTSVVIPDGVTTIEDFTFIFCSSLTSVVIPESVASIGYRAFNSCRSLTTVTIPDSVTSVGDQAFVACISLTSAVIGDGVASIGDGAFQACIRPTGVYFNGDAPVLGGTDVFLDADLATVYYLAGTAGWGPTYGGRPTALVSDPDFELAFDNGTVTITGYTGPGGAVNIPDSIGGLPVARIGRGAFLNELGRDGKLQRLVWLKA